MGAPRVGDVARVLRVYWHERQPVFSADWTARGGPDGCSLRLATAGGDATVRVWRIEDDAEAQPGASGASGGLVGSFAMDEETDNVITGCGGGEANAHPTNHSAAGSVPPDAEQDEGAPRLWRPVYCATLAKHTRPVNCVRFSHAGDVLASAGDGGALVLWRRSAGGAPPAVFGAEQGDAADDPAEAWAAFRVLQAGGAGREDVYDLCWSPDDAHLLVALTDNTAQVWDVAAGRAVRTLREHAHFVQGVAWDPHGQLVATVSCDRSARVWRRRGDAFSVAARLLRHGDAAMFLDEGLVSFFRRPAFSPDGALVFLPAGQTPAGEARTHCVWLLARNQLASPLFSVGGFRTAVIGVRCSPRLFRAQKGKSRLALPYRIVYAVYTIDSLAVFETSREGPVLHVRDLHYGTLTDVAWLPCGRRLVVTATDGFCSAISVPGLGAALSDGEQAAAVASARALAVPVPAGICAPAAAAECVSELPMSELQVSGSSQPGEEGVQDAPVVRFAPLPEEPQPASTDITQPRRRIQPTLISPL